MKWLLLLFSFNSFAGFSELKDSYDYSFNKKQIQKKQKASKKKSELDSLLRKVEKADRGISEFLEANSKKVIVKRSKDKVRALTRIRGVLLNSVIATNQVATTLIIELVQNEFFDNAEIRCKGLSFGKRVQSKCDLIVSDEFEKRINAEVWDLDGAEGIIADKFYSGEESEFLKSSFSTFFEGVLSASKDRVMTPYGESSRVNSKNQVLSGLIGVAKNANTKVKESIERNLQVAFVNSDREVYVLFHEGVEL